METTESDLELYEIARSAASLAYAPYSNFAVGAALRTTDGTVYRGVNVENASLGLSICAERSAVVSAVASGARGFEAIAVHGDGSSVAPCGACRQVLAEFAPELRVIWRRDGVPVASSLADLLPERFRL
jgi:cytidine deaminase